MTAPRTTDPHITAARIIADHLLSPNVLDINGEPANVVDGLYAIAAALDRLAHATCGCDDCQRTLHPGRERAHRPCRCRQCSALTADSEGALREAR